MTKEHLEVILDLFLQLGFKITEKETFLRYEAAYRAVEEEIQRLNQSLVEVIQG